MSKPSLTELWGQYRRYNYWSVPLISVSIIVNILYYVQGYTEVCVYSLLIFCIWQPLNVGLVSSWGRCTEEHTCLQVANTWKPSTFPNPWCLHPSYRWAHNTCCQVHFLWGILTVKGFKWSGWEFKCSPHAKMWMWLCCVSVIRSCSCQHPSLTAGQRRYLCSIANVYSTEDMRQQMKRYYLSVLHTYVQTGVYLKCLSQIFNFSIHFMLYFLLPRSEFQLQEEVWGLSASSK